MSELIDKNELIQKIDIYVKSILERNPDSDDEVNSQLDELKKILDAAKLYIVLVPIEGRISAATEAQKTFGALLDKLEDVGKTLQDEQKHAFWEAVSGFIEDHGHQQKVIQSGLAIFNISSGDDFVIPLDLAALPTVRSGSYIRASDRPKFVARMLNLKGALAEAGQGAKGDRFAQLYRIEMNRLQAHYDSIVRKYSRVTRTPAPGSNRQPG